MKSPRRCAQGPAFCSGESFSIRRHTRADTGGEAACGPEAAIRPSAACRTPPVWAGSRLPLLPPGSHTPHHRRALCILTSQAPQRSTFRVVVVWRRGGAALPAPLGPGGRRCSGVGSGRRPPLRMVAASCSNAVSPSPVPFPSPHRKVPPFPTAQSPPPPLSFLQVVR